MSLLPTWNEVKLVVVGRRIAKAVEAAPDLRGKVLAAGEGLRTISPLTATPLDDRALVAFDQLRANPVAFDLFLQVVQRYIDSGETPNEGMFGAGPEGVEFAQFGLNWKLILQLLLAILPFLL